MISKRMLEINLTGQHFHELRVNENKLRKCLDDSGIATKYLYQYLDQKITALNPNNLFLFLPSLLTGGVPILTASKTFTCSRSLLVNI